MSGRRSATRACAFAVAALLCLGAFGRQSAALGFITLSPNLRIDGIAPATGLVGDTVIITGRGFDQLPLGQTNTVGGTWVKFGNRLGYATSATFVRESATRIRATVPADAVSGPIYITQRERFYLVGAEPRWFTVAQSPTSFTVTIRAPTNLVATTMGYNAVRLDWTYTGTGQTGFQLQYRMSGGAWQTLQGTLAANLRSEYFVGLSPGTAHDFRLIARKGAISSSPSNVATATTGAAPTVSITNSTIAPSPFQDAGSVAEIVEARAYFDVDQDGTIDLAPNDFPSDAASWFPRFVTGVSGTVLRGNRLIAYGNAVVLVKFRTRSGRPVEFACVHAEIDENGTLADATMLAGDFEQSDWVLGLASENWNEIGITVQPATIPGRISGVADAYLAVDSPAVAAAAVRFTFDLLLEPESWYTP